jgi:hypothetical protein
MKMKLLVLIISILLLNQACGDKEENCHKTITFKNISNNSLYVVGSSFYPDTLSFIGIPNPVLDSSHTKVLPEETNTRMLWGRDCIELAFKDLIPSDTMIIYVFDTHVLETTPWVSVKANYMVLKRFDLSIENLENSNWTITYP